MNAYREKLLSLAAPRSRTWHKTEHQYVQDDRDGVVRGRHDIHWDGSQDATATPRTLTARMTTEEE